MQTNFILQMANNFPSKINHSSKNLPVNQIYFKTNSPDKIKPVLQFHATLQESN